MNSYVTGQWNNCGVTDVSGGLLQAGSLLLGNGGKDGKINISGGNVVADYLSINVGGGALMNIGTNGSFIAAASNLGNINYWINNNAIRAENGAAGWAINVDTASQAGKVVLTAVNVASVPEPSTFLTLGTGLVLLCATRSLRRKS
ncbi:MAG: PEP-CTERM sorting domain-containing protein [Verrucomicrobia bacterium]|nr:PEP-CTERM sorting domain-containing protein [Verrucomicrobiota bacterium]